MKALKLALAGALAAGLAMGAAPASAELKDKKFTVVGTWGFLDHWKERESKFWNETLPGVTDGKYTANAKSQTEVGLSGFEIMKLLKIGTYDAVHGVTNYVAQDSPAIEGVDLAGVIQDIDVYRTALESYEHIIAPEFDEKYKAKLLLLYAWPSQQLWCNMGDKSITNVSLADLKGKKIRTYSTTLGDFIEGVGGSAVTIAFAEVVPALQKGVADCGLTGTLPAYNAKWYQVVTHNIRIRLGYASSFMAMNNKTWNSLSAQGKAIIQGSMPDLTEAMWTATRANDQRGMDCNASGPCDIGEPGGMIPIEPSEADKVELQRIAEEVVVGRWAKRCGTQKCLDEWNATVGALSGVKAKL